MKRFPLAFATVAACFMMLLAAVPATAQQVGQNPQQTAAATPQEQYAELKVLLLARALNLTQQQVQAIVPLANTAIQARADRQTALDTVVTQYQGAQAMAKLVAAWAAGQTLNKSTRTETDAVTGIYNRVIQISNDRVYAATDKMIALLSDQQRALIEPFEVTEARRNSAVSANASPTKYFVDQLKVVRNLPENDYLAVKMLLARDIAERIAAFNNLGANEMWPLTMRIAGIFDVVTGWSNADYEERMTNVPNDIAERFDLPYIDEQAIPTPRFNLEDVDNFLVNPATPQLLQEMKFTGATIAVPYYGFADPGTEMAAKRLADVTDTRHQLTQYMDLIDTIRLISILNPEDAQLQTFIPIATALQDGYNKQRQTWAQRLQGRNREISQLRQALLAGTPLTDQLSGVASMLREEEIRNANNMIAIASTQLANARKALYDDQAALVNWTPPLMPSASEAQAVQEQIDDLLDVSADLMDFMNFFRDMRYVEPVQYQAIVGNSAADLLANYINPNDRGFKNAVNYLIGVCQDVRASNEDEWGRDLAAMFAVDAMAGLNILPELHGLTGAGKGNSSTRMIWWDMETALSDPLATNAITRMRQTRAPR